MRKSRFTESQILAILGEGEAGLAVAEVCRKHGILGPKTLAAALAADPGQIKANVLAERVVFMASLPTWPMFSRGWARRMAELMFTGDKPRWQ